ncbi:MAG: hypothetical protein JWQ34_1004 [Mucilaginibacter sp.]|uniref:outer membrane beta-barrel protein n=1 Tax=Mucilaginibacter sp. TaxID=1882438 RepID=UPI00261FB3B4|nr:outer membrane beta-barrel protein [Mucilaginibacter sp.]MDB5002779.1 hypothetical protein [Mucilaginibacter sp.]
MKKLYIIAGLVLLSVQLFAQREDRQDRMPQTQQRPTTTVLPPLAKRDVSGIIKDESGQTVIGALVTLKSKTDTISGATNADGIFIFKGVKQNTFNITVKNLGSKPFVQKYAFSDTKKNVVLDPITLKNDSKQLDAVTINGTPSVVYKEDTVEYRASDYKVRANATVDELLKKMEGMEVGTDGSLTHQGQEVTRAKLNGKEYAGGSVAQAIQNLPADIVEKIQIVDDYGDQAARTGVKDGDPQKILNITTKADRSVGTTGRVTGQYGSAGRYNGQLFLQRINANQQLGVIGNLRNTVLGVSSNGLQGGATNDGGGGSGVGTNARGGGGGSSGPSGGTTHSGSPSFNYRDQWTKNIQVIGSYAYNFRNNNALNDSYGKNYITNGTFMNNSTSENDSKSHNLRFEMDINLDSANYLQITPSYSYSNSSSMNKSFSDAINNYPATAKDTAKFEHRVDNGTNSSVNSSSTYGLTAFYLHLFKKPKRNFSFQIDYNESRSNANSEQNTHYNYFADATLDIPLPKLDSIAHNVTTRTNQTKSLQATITYVEPLSTKSLLEFSANWSHRYNSANSLVSVYDTLTNVLRLAPQYSSIYDYTVTEARGTIDYRYVGTKVNISLGASAVPFNLDGTKLNAAVGSNASTSINNFRFIPAFRFSYSWSRTERFTLNYSGRNQEPSFTEIQPFTDISNPGHVIVGNPNLKPSFTNSLNAQYNNYFANSKFNVSFGVIASQVDNAIVQNNNTPTVNGRKITETEYRNIGGTQSVVGRYSISKQSENRAINLALNGNVTYSFSPQMRSNLVYHQTTWRLDERFGPRITPSEDFEINPYIGYDIARYFTSLPDIPDPGLNKTLASTGLTNAATQLETSSLGLQGRMYFFKTWQINYDATKRFISGISGGNTTPLIINAGFEKEFLAKKNLVFTFNVYDLLHQNNYLQKVVTGTGETNTISNTLSRYFMVGLRLNLQKWSGTPQRNGRNMNRRGDGSFIY